MARRALPFLFGLLTGLLAAGMLYLLLSEPRGEPVKLLPPATPGPLRVHVTGAVANPGVYALPSGAIVVEALEAAGGATDEAALEMVNLAAPLEDGAQVFIPAHRPTAESSGASPVSAPAASAGLINVNTASSAELESLPGIGPAMAQKIIEYRQQNGPFLKPEDLLYVPGIGPARLEAIRDLITVY